MTPDVVYDQMIGMGCARGLVFSWGGNPGVGSLHRLREAGWSVRAGVLTVEEARATILEALRRRGAAWTSPAGGPAADGTAGT